MRNSLATDHKVCCPVSDKAMLCPYTATLELFSHEESRCMCHV